MQLFCGHGLSSRSMADFFMSGGRSLSSGSVMKWGVGPILLIANWNASGVFNFIRRCCGLIITLIGRWSLTSGR